MGETVKFFLDERPLEVPRGTTIMQAADRAGVSIPRFCYHPAFAPEGSCRLCLVEIEGSPKLELSCATVVREGMKVLTKTDRVIQARRSVLEFILAEHPLDCPICDKAGECDLQDYYQQYGLYQSAFREFKERREKKVALGKTLVLDRERCVLCTRCVRFTEQVTKTEELGVFNRGLKSEVGIYDETPVDNNYSGCLAEICPVGAITDTDFRFKTRAWLLERKESICHRCGRGCPIIIEHVPGMTRVPGSRRIYRVKARPEPEANGNWICDVGRYGYPDLDAGRQENIMVKGWAGRDEPTWEDTLRAVADRLQAVRSQKSPDRAEVWVSSQLTNEELFLARRIFGEDLGLRNLRLLDPPDGAPDGLLLTAERTANRRGAKELGLVSGPADLGRLAGKVEVVLQFGLAAFEGAFGNEARPFLDTVGTKVLFTWQACPEAANFDFVLPTAPPAEKSGSFTNIQGRVQRFDPVRASCGQALAEWDILVRLAQALGIRPEFYSRLNGIEDIGAALGRAVPFFHRGS